MIKVGEIVDGKYRVTRVLGQGGMGMVVEAYRDTLDMHVAIKFMRTDVVSASGGPERFLREAKALVKLKSQHAVKVHDMGVHRRMPYIVMEHLEGMDMQTMLDKHGPMKPAEAARHMRQACEAIAEAHSLGIYHRDLKPANLFLAQGPGGRIIVKVLDFGIAKMLRPAENKASLQDSLTGLNVLIGTVPYMSPEQLVSAKDIDARADIWSLGVVLYELVTGALPFSGRDLAEMQQAIRYETCLLPAFPASLEPIIRRCLQKNRADRYASAADLALALRPLVNDSLSPFGSNPLRIEPQALEAETKRSPTASPIPAPRQSTLDLAVAEGLAVFGVSGSNTIRVARDARVEIIDVHPLLDAAPDSEMTATLRVPAHIASRGTLIMAQETPEPPTVKRPQPQLQARVETVRRNVLVVKQPIKLSRRRRSSIPAIPRKSKLVMGSLAACALMVSLAWPLQSLQQRSEMAMSWSSAIAARIVSFY